MADRYWVGGTGTWNTSSTTNWSATSGGGGGASVPTTADAVIFNGSSGAGTITLTGALNCQSLTTTGSSFTFSSTGTINIAGSMLLSATTVWSASGTLTFTGTGAQTINTAGLAMTCTINVNAPSGSYGLGAAVAITPGLSGGGFTLTAGTFATNNFNMTANIFTMTGSLTRSFAQGTSQLSTVGSGFNSIMWNATGATNFTYTYSAGATMLMRSTGSAALGFGGNGYSYPDVTLTFTNTSATPSITGDNTFANLTIAAGGTGTQNYTLAGNQTVTGTFTVNGTTGNRIAMRSTVVGTTRTITIGTKNINFITFTDVVLAAVTPTTFYWVGGTGTWDIATKTNWSLSSGGSGGVNGPTITDNVIIDGSSGTGTITTSAPVCNNLTVTASQAITLSGVLNVYGSLAFPSGGSFVFSNSGLTFRSTTTGKTIADNNKIVGNVTFNGVGGGWTLTTNLGFANYVTLVLEAGTFNTGNFNIQLAGGTSLFLSGSSNTQTATRAMYLGSSTLTFIGGSSGIQSSATNTGLTFDAGTSLLNFTANFLTISTIGLTYYDVTDSNTSATNGANITGANTFRNLSFVGPASAGIKIVNFAANQTVNGTFSAIGLNGNQRITVQSNDFITQRTITAAAVSLTDVNFNEIVGAGAATWSGTRLSNGGGNSGITFDTPKTVYWNLVAGGDFFATAWATSSGGTPATTNHPLGQDTAIIENTGLNSGATITGGPSGSVISNLTFATRTLPVTFTIMSNPFAVGNITLSSAVTRAGTQRIYFSGNTTLTMAGAGIWTNAIAVSGTLTIADSVTMSGGAYDVYVGGTLTLNAPLTISAFTITNSGGTINLNSHTLTALGCTINNTPTINFGTGSINLTGTGGWNASGATFTGTSNIIISTQSGAVTFAGGGLTYSKLTLGNNTNSTAQVTITGSNTFGEISSNAFGGTLLLTASTTQTVTNFTYGGYKDTIYNVAYAGLTSTTTTAANLIKSGGGTINVDYLRVSYVNVTPTSTWNALRSLSVIGTNTNWSFSGYPGNYGYTDIGVPIENKYVTKDYVMDYYPDLLPNFVTPQLFTWGINVQGRLGDGTTTSRSSPGTTAGGGTNWKQVDCGAAQIAAIKTDGTLWTWGLGSQGRLGDGTTTTRSSPGTTAGGGTNWKQASCGAHTAAIKTDGTLWTWGSNANGRLGDGTTTSRSSPGTTAGGGTNWKEVTCGYHTAAIKTDGTLWTWGLNTSGQLGDGTTTSRLSPGTTAGGGSNWKQVDVIYNASYTVAIKTDGTLWTWGLNTNGQLGTGNTTARSSPGTTAGGGSNWKQVSCSSVHTAAIKTDGTLWTWGQNSLGQLGDGTTTSRLSPGTTAGGGTNWKKVACGYRITMAIKTDGTLWTWGQDSYGQLGAGAPVSARSSPATIIGGGTNWKQISCGDRFVAAISESEGW